MSAAVWFLRHSWTYLGCDRGTGRWRARRRYLVWIAPKMVWFVRQDRRDRRRLA